MKTKAALPTSEEVDHRLRIVTELRNLCLSLGRARAVENEGHAKPPVAEYDCAASGFTAAQSLDAFVLPQGTRSIASHPEFP